MFKQIIAIVVLSVLLVVLQPYATEAVKAILSAHDWLNGLLSDVIADGSVGQWIKRILSFLALPFFVGAVIALIYGIVRKSFPSFFMTIVWTLWVILATELLLATPTAAVVA